MKTIQHKEFLLKSQIQVIDLPKPIKDTISVFDSLHTKLNRTKGEHQRKLTNELKQLDKEIYAELLEYFQDDLENNELEVSDKVYHNRQKQVSPIPENDFKIIDTLHKKGIKSVGRSGLIMLGFKGDLEQRTLEVGKYLLTRALLSYTYYITLKKNPKKKT